MDTDNQLLIRRLKHGEEAAYEMLFKEYYKMLCMYSYKYLKDMEMAKELVQDLFVKLYEKRESLDINSSLKSYLFRSVHNRSINQINSQKIRDRYAEQVNFSQTIEQDSFEEEVNASEMENALYLAIDDLPPKCREIFKLNRFDGLSNGEIADKLTLSKRTVETQISKALKILRNRLETFQVAGSIILALGIRLLN